MAMFVDQVKIHVQAGHGGNGIVSFRHENMWHMVVHSVVMVEKVVTSF